MCFGHDSALNDVLGQKPDGPARVTFRRFGAGKRDELGLRLGVEDRWRWRALALLAGQHRTKSLGHELFARSHDHGQVGIKRFDDLRVQPAGPTFRLVGLQKDARLEDRLGRRLARRDKSGEQLALACIKFDDVLLGRHVHPPVASEPDRE